MTLERLLGKVVLFGSLSLFSYNCQSVEPDSTSCVKDTDCKGERICEKNVCVDKTSSQAKYTCETACTHFLYECACTVKPTQSNYDQCVKKDCGGIGSRSNTPWTQSKIDYVSTASCKDLGCKNL